jgi:hypothetical protein
LNRKLQIFISSTYTDLITERQAAVSAILKSGHIPAGMELFTAGDKSQMQTIKDWINESDVYMLILGGRYGSVEKSSGISYTELEYDYALEQGKPLFAVVIKEEALEAKVKAHGSAFMERTHPNELAQFRAKVLGNISSFFDDPKDIRLCVHESLSEFSTKRELKGWISAKDVVDTKPLVEQIQKLTEENSILRTELNKLEQRQTISTDTDSKGPEAYKELKKLLQAIHIKVPKDIHESNKEIEHDLLNIFYGNKDTLITGVTNRTNASPAEQFFYFNVCPKLQLHGLTINETVPGVNYRRSQVSELGRWFLATMDKEQIRNTEVARALMATAKKSPPSTARAAGSTRRRRPGNTAT